MGKMPSVVFKSIPDFSDNPRALFDLMQKEGGYALHWIVDDERLVPLMEESGISCSVSGSGSASELLENADVIVTTHFEFADRKKPDQLYVCTWHGLPLKTVGFFETANPGAEGFCGLRQLTVQSDIVVATSRSCQISMAGMFAMDPRKVMVTGYPRLDIMFDSDGKGNLSKLVDIERDAKLILYMPTMRKGQKDEGETFSENIFNFPDYDPEELDWFLEANNAYLVAKLHFADNDFFSDDSFALPQRMMLLGTEDFTHELLTVYHVLNAFDVLIADYSSIYTEFLLLDRPIIFSCPDLEEYKKDRGFIVDDPTLLMPGPIVVSQAELIEELLHALGPEDRFRERRNVLKPYFHSYIDDRSSERLLETIKAAAMDIPPDCDKDFASLYVRTDIPLSQYTHRYEAEFYFDGGEGLTDDDMLAFEYSADSSSFAHVEFDIPLPDGFVRAIRFDPDHTNRVILRNFEAVLDGKPLKYDVVNGFEQNDIIVFETNDPQILIWVHRSGDLAEGGTIKIRYELSDMLHHGANLLACEWKANGPLKREIREKTVQLGEAKEELNRMRSSTSWKMTKPLRRIARLWQKLAIRILNPAPR